MMCICENCRRLLVVRSLRSEISRPLTRRFCASGAARRPNCRNCAPLARPVSSPPSGTLENRGGASGVLSFAFGHRKAIDAICCRATPSQAKHADVPAISGANLLPRRAAVVLIASRASRLRAAAVRAVDASNCLVSDHFDEPAGCPAGEASARASSFRGSH